MTALVSDGGVTRIGTRIGITIYIYLYVYIIRQVVKRTYTFSFVKINIRSLDTIESTKAETESVEIKQGCTSSRERGRSLDERDMNVTRKQSSQTWPAWCLPAITRHGSHGPRSYLASAGCSAPLGNGYLSGGSLREEKQTPKTADQLHWMAD